MKNLPDGGIYPKTLYLQIKAELKEVYAKLKPEDKKAMVMAFRDRIIFRAFFIAYTPPEEFSLRSSLYRIFDPVEYTYRLARILEGPQVGSNPFLIRFIADLRQCFRITWMVDLQKQHGRPGSIVELRKKFLRQSVDPDGNEIIEEDHWPFAKMRRTRTAQGEIYYEYHLLQDPANEDEVNNLFDQASLWTIQELERLGQKLQAMGFQTKVDRT